MEPRQQERRIIPAAAQPSIRSARVDTPALERAVLVEAAEVAGLVCD
jgi:hypothetical protein